MIQSPTTVLLKQVRVAREHLDRILTIASNAKRPEEVAALLDEILDVVIEALNEHMGGIYVAEGGYLRLAACRDPQGLIAKLGILERWPLFMLADGKKALVVSLCPAKTHDDALGLALRRKNYQALLIVPATYQEASAYLFVASTSPLAFGEESATAFEALGRLLGVVLENSWLRQQNVHFLSHMARQQRESQTLYEISLAFVSTTNLDDLLDLIVQAAVKTIDAADNCVLHLLDERTGELLPRALSFTTLRQKDGGRSRMRPGHGVAGLALERAQVINVGDVARDPRFVRVGQVRPFASIMVAPLKLGERRIGTLSVDSTMRFAFSPNDERLLMTLATQAAAAIENARLVSDLQQSLLKLQTTQAQLIQSEKLSAIGQLIAGVAHELNNPLTAVMGYAQLLQASAGMDNEVLEDVRKIHLQAQRAAKIVQNLLTFAREQKAERRFIDVNDIIRRTLELRAYQLKMENIQVVTHLSPQALGAMADASQLQQVFLNLVNNAQDAMIEYRHGGILVVSSRLRGDTIEVRFSDNGPGFTDEVKQHLFEPFFTTKEVGKGTGLGLSICFGIIQEHGGRIWAEGEPDKGATFVVELPVAEPPIQVDEEKTDSALLSPVKGSRILVVDDEQEVAKILERALARDGHQVVLARDGRNALEYLERVQSGEEHFELIVSDIKMPGMDGIALYDRIQQQTPELANRVIFITGDTLNPTTKAFLNRVCLPCLTKPFSIGEFRSLVTHILAA